MIEILTVTGKNTKAIEAYNNLSHLLGVELGIKPNEESTDLIRRLLIDHNRNITLN